MRLGLAPRTWQTEALDAWKAEQRGVVAAVTGAGKTGFALLCIDSFLSQHPDGRILVVVPTIALADQWVVTLEDDGGVPADEVGVAGGGRSEWKEKRFTIAVINTARRLDWQAGETKPTMLVVDECHRAGSTKNAGALSGQFSAALGLSATPERQYDDGFEALVKPVLGTVIYRYDYARAVNDRVIVPFLLANVHFPLTTREAREYERLSQRAAILSAREQPPQHEIEAVLRRRARVSWNSRLRVPLAVKLALRHAKERSIIFFEAVQQANEAHALLRQRGVRATVYHTGLAAATRQQNLRLYRRGFYNCMVCCRALDEGLDVPTTSVGIIACGTASQRQRIQRLGRVLRASATKKEATVYTLYATEAERRRLAAEEGRANGASQVAWMAMELI